MGRKENKIPENITLRAQAIGNVPSYQQQIYYLKVGGQRQLR